MELGEEQRRDLDRSHAELRAKLRASQEQERVHEAAMYEMRAAMQTARQDRETAEQSRDSVETKLPELTAEAAELRGQNAALTEAGAAAARDAVSMRRRIEELEEAVEHAQREATDTARREAILREGADEARALTETVAIKTAESDRRATEVAGLEARVAELAEERDELCGERGSIASRLDDHRASLEVAHREASQAHRDLAARQAEFDSLELDHSLVSAELRTTQGMAAKLEEGSKEFVESNVSLQRAVTELEEKLQASEMRGATLGKECDVAEQVAAKARNMWRLEQTECASLTRRVETLAQDGEALQAELRRVAGQGTGAAAENVRLHAELATLQGERKAAERDRDRAAVEVSQLQTKLEVVTEDRDRFKVEVRDEGESASSLRRQIQSIHEKYVSHERALWTMGQEMDALRQEKSEALAKHRSLQLAHEDMQRRAHSDADNLVEARRRCQELELDVESMSGQLTVSEEFRATAEKRMGELQETADADCAQNDLLGRRIQDLDEEAAARSGEIVDLAQRCGVQEKIVEEHKVLAERFTVLQGRFDELQSLTRRIREENESLCTFRQREEDDTTTLRSRIEELKHALQDVQDAAASAADTHSTTAKDNDAYVDELKEDNQALGEKLGAARTEIAEGLAHAEVLSKQCDDLDTQLLHTQQQLTRLELDRSVPMEKIEADLHESKRIQQRVEIENASLRADLQEATTQARSRIALLEEQLGTSQEAREVCLGRLEEMQEDVRHKTDELEDATKTATELGTALAETRASLSTTTGEAERTKTRLEGELEDVRDDRNHLKTALQRRAEEESAVVDDVRASLLEAKLALNRSEVELAEAMSAASQAESREREARALVGDSRAELTVAQEQAAVLRSDLDTLHVTTEALRKSKERWAEDRDRLTGEVEKLEEVRDVSRSELGKLQSRLSEVQSAVTQRAMESDPRGHRHQGGGQFGYASDFQQSSIDMHGSVGGDIRALRRKMMRFIETEKALVADNQSLREQLAQSQERDESLSRLIHEKDRRVAFLSSALASEQELCASMQLNVEHKSAETTRIHHAR